MSDSNRRDFLKTTAGVAISSALGGGSALFAGEGLGSSHRRYHRYAHD